MPVAWAGSLVVVVVGVVVGVVVVNVGVAVVFVLVVGVVAVGVDCPRSGTPTPSGLIRGCPSPGSQALRTLSNFIRSQIVEIV